MAASEAQIIANRRNAARSTGPKIAEGKGSSRRNALKHVLTGEGVALTNEDSVEDARPARLEALARPTLADPGRPRPTPASTDDVPRIALAALLVGAVLIGWRWHREWLDVARRAGYVTVGIAFAAVLAFEVAPDLFAWADFGLPWWLRMAGLPIGFVAMTASKRPGPAALSFGVSCAMLSSSWVVALMALRGWLRSGFSIRASLDQPSDLQKDTFHPAGRRQP